MQLFQEDGSYILMNEGLDISIPLRSSADNPTAWYVSAPKFEPVRANGWVGAVAEGGSVNFRDVYFNPHGHGTHTECLGHITPEVHSVNGMLKKLFYKTILISVTPEKRVHADGDTDQVITRNLLEPILQGTSTEALVIRTLPNSFNKCSRHYSETNPAYIDLDTISLLNECGILHLLIDTPSVDREKDNGELAFHHAFWGVPGNERFDRTISEMVFISDEIKDGEYLMNLQTAPFENDATPSRPVLFPIHRNQEEV
jgi:kynurenine formamidase